MKPIDFRNETFEQLQARIAGLKRVVYLAWKAHGPGTTREVAMRSGLDLLTFRPRTTELVQLGFVCLTDEQADASEGCYRARTFEEWNAWFAQQRERVNNPQLQLV